MLQPNLRRERFLAVLGTCPDGGAAGAGVNRAVDTAVTAGVVLRVWQALFLYAGDVAITPPGR